MKIIKAQDLTQSKYTVLIYGTPGMGKTTLLGNLRGRTLIVDVDRGTSVLAGNPNVDIVRLSEDLRELQPLVQELQGKCEYDNVCIDSLSELERGMLTVYGRRGNNGVPTLQDYNRVDFKIMDYCRQFRNINANIFFTAWESAREITAITGEKYSQLRPMLRDKDTENICGLCDIVGRIVVNPKDEERYIWLEGTQSLLAKDRIFKRKFCKFEELIPDGKTETV